MNTEIITQEQFQAVIETIPGDAQGMGFDLKSVYYSYRREESGVVKGEPYLKTRLHTNFPKTKTLSDRECGPKAKILV